MYFIGNVLLSNNIYIYIYIYIYNLFTFQDPDTGLPLNSTLHLSQKQDLSMDPMMQHQQEMSMVNFDQSNQRMMPSVNPVMSEEQVFDDYGEDQMVGMDPQLDSRPGQQQDYFDSEYGSSRSPPLPSCPHPPPQPSHATASVSDSKLDTSEIDGSETTMTPRAMAAFQQHQEFIEPDTKRYRKDIALSRQDSATSIPSSSDMISVKNIEDREDEYGKMKLALLSDIIATSYNGSSSPIAAITSPSLAHDLLSPRGKEEELSSVHRDKSKLGPRTRSRDNLESIFGGTTSGHADKLNLNVSNTSVVHRPVFNDDHENIVAVASNYNIPDKIYEQRAHAGITSTTHTCMSNSSVKTATITTAYLSNSKPTTCNSNSNRSHGINYNKDNQVNKDTLNTSQNKTIAKYTNDAKCPSSPTRVYHHNTDDIDKRHSTTVPSVPKERQVPKHVDKARRVNRHHRPSGFVREETFPVDISPESNVISADLRSTKAKIKGELDGSLGSGGKRGSTSTAPTVSSTTTGDVYTIPEVPEEEEDYSPLGADGVSRRRIAGKLQITLL